MLPMGKIRTFPPIGPGTGSSEIRTSVGTCFRVAVGNTAVGTGVPDGAAVAIWVTVAVSAGRAWTAVAGELVAMSGGLVAVMTTTTVFSTTFSTGLLKGKLQADKIKTTMRNLMIFLENGFSQLNFFILFSLHQGFLWPHQHLFCLDCNPYRSPLS